MSQKKNTERQSSRGIWKRILIQMWQTKIRKEFSLNASFTDDWKEIGAKWSDLIWIKINRQQSCVLCQPTYWYAIVLFFIFEMRVEKKSSVKNVGGCEGTATPEKNFFLVSFILFILIVQSKRHFVCKTVTNLLIEWTGPTAKKFEEKSVNKHKKGTNNHNRTIANKTKKGVGNLWFFWAFPLSNHK